MCATLAFEVMLSVYYYTTIFVVNIEETKNSNKVVQRSVFQPFSIAQSLVSYIIIWLHP
jgi:hypothetical protein